MKMRISFIPTMTKVFLSACIGLHLVSTEQTSTSRTIIRDEQHSLNDKIWLFAVDGRRKPYHFIDDNGKLSGFNIDFINKVCEVANKRCDIVLSEFTECTFTERNINYAGRGLMSKWFDACPGYVTSADRKGAFDFTLPYLQTYATFTVSPDNPSGFDPNLGHFSNYTLTHLDGAVTNAQCLNRLGMMFKKVIVAANLPDAKNLLSNKTADVLFSPRSYIPGLKTFTEKFHCDNGGVAVMLKKGSEMAGWWNRAFSKLVQDGSFSNFCSSSQIKYNSTIKCLDTKSLQFTPELHQTPMKKVWLFGISGRRKPFAYINDNGDISGFNVDFVNGVCREAGEVCQFVLTPFTECSFTSRNINYAGRGLMDGWFDACPGYADAIDRANAVDFTDAFLRSGCYFAVLPGNPSGFNPNQNDFSNFTITHLTGAYTNAACLNRLNKKFGKIIIADNLPDAKNLLNERKADVIFAPRRQIPDLYVFDVRFNCAQSGSAVMTKKGSPLISWWNRAFRSYVKKGLFAQLCTDSIVKYNYSVNCITEDFPIVSVIG